MANLISNGSFVGHADGWYPDFPSSTSSWAAGTSRSVESGCLSVARDNPNADIVWRPAGVPVVPLGALGTVDLVAYARTETADADATAAVSVAFFDSATGATEVGLETGTFVGINHTTWTELALRDVVVPVGATHALVSVTRLSAAAPHATVLVDDVYFGAPDGDAAPYEAGPAIPLATNRVVNGGFALGIAGWSAWWGDETLTLDTGRLKVDPTGTDPEQGVAGPPHGIVVVPSETITISFEIEGTGAFELFTEFGGSPYASVWTGTVSGVQTVAQDVVVPAAASGLGLIIATATADPDPFWLDNIAVGSVVTARPNTVIPHAISASRIGMGLG